MTGRRAAAFAAIALCAALCVPVVADDETIITSLTLFAGTPAGLMRSTDWGHTWKPLPLASPDPSALPDAPVPPQSPVNTILPLGTKVFVGADAGLYGSDDYGVTWHPMVLAQPIAAVLPSRFPLSDPTVFAGTASGLVKSVDAGATFRPTALMGTRITRIEWPGPDVVVATGRGVFRSTDGGATFAGPGAGLPAGEVTALAVSSYFAIDPVMFAGVSDRGVFRSGDRGATWAPTGLVDACVEELVWIGPQLYAATDRGLYRSDDAGAHWALVKGLPPPVHAILFPLAPTSSLEAFAGTDDGVYRTTDGGTNWEAWGGRGLQFRHLATFPQPDPVVTKKKR